jgi:hypothetical protein
MAASDRVIRCWPIFLALVLAACGESEPASDALTVVASAAPAAAPPVAPAPDRGQPGHPDLPLDPDRALPPVLRGVTTTTGWIVPDLTEAIAAHSVAPTVRIVFDPQPRPEQYRPVVEALRPHAYLMGEPIDSSAMKRYTPEEVATRADDYVRTFGDRIDLWEIGNELNGSWVGKTPEEIDAKLQAAFDVVKGRYAKRTAVTLNYWSGPNCYAKPWEDTLTFARQIPAGIREGTDFILLSIYETACKPPQHPSAADIGDMLAKLAPLFPNARLGIGEVGTQGVEDGLRRDPSFRKKRRIAEYYYGMDAALRARLGERYVGGYFWWYYAEDAVPRRKKKSLWPTLDRLLVALG